MNFVAASGRRPLDPLARTSAGARTPAAVADLWLERALGTSLVDSRRQALVDYLAAGRSEHRAVPWSQPGHPERLRSFVALVLMTPDFLAR